MGYTTDFSGSVSIEPPLNDEERDFINKFSSTRRMERTKGPYFVDGTGMAGQGRDKDIVNFNSPPDGQPGLWCQWVISDDGASIEWDGNEKFYESPEWMAYIIDHFLKPGAIAKPELPFLQANHVCDGVIDAQGEDYEDMWRLSVKDNVVKVIDAVITFPED